MTDPLSSVMAAVQAASEYAARSTPELDAAGGGRERDNLRGAWYAGYCYGTTKGRVWRDEATGRWCYTVAQRGVQGIKGTGLTSWDEAYGRCLRHVEGYRGMLR